LETVQGIVLRGVKFSDSQQVVTVYTRQHGTMACVAPLVRTQRNRSANLWRPLNLVEFLVPERGGSRMPRPSQPRLYVPYGNLPHNPVKCAMAIFLSDMLWHVLQAEQADEPLYGFLEGALVAFDRKEDGYANFHLALLVELMGYLGIQPDPESPPQPPFPLDLRVEGMDAVALNREQRGVYLQNITRYYQEHLAPFSVPPSLGVLQEVFEGL